MQSGLAWNESGYAYTPGSGNGAVKMLATGDWSKYVIDRPMAARPGTTFAYDSGTAHLASAAITVLTRGPAAAFAAQRVFAPPGIRRVTWLAAPEGASAGGFGLSLRPRSPPTCRRAPTRQPHALAARAVRPSGGPLRGRRLLPFPPGSGMV
jgi:CubicO group peptidase (beta-lactamase class C family)